MMERKKSKRRRNNGNNKRGERRNGQKKMTMKWGILVTSTMSCKNPQDKKS